MERKIAKNSFNSLEMCYIKKPQTTRPRFVNYEKIAEYIKNNPDKTQKEIGKEFGYKDKAICYSISLNY